MKRYLQSLFIGFLLVAITACGFHLRGSADLPVILQTMYVQGINMQEDLGRKLKRGLIHNGVTVLSDYQQGSAVLTILDKKIERRVLSVGRDTKASEYELHGIVKFKVSDGNGNLLSDSQQVEAQRNYQFDQNQVLGKEEEEGLLREELNQQLVHSILRRLSVL